MIVEHTFVTTMEAADAIQTARRLLEARGFLRVEEATLPTASTLELRRGKKNPARAKSIVELPQELRFQWDRGRVTVAVSITPYDPVWGGVKPSAYSGSDSDATSPRFQDHRELLFAIAKSLEGLLARLEPPEQARALWEELELKLVLEAQKRRRRKWIIVAIVVAFLATVIFVGFHSAR